MAKDNNAPTPNWSSSPRGAESRRSQRVLMSLSITVSKEDEPTSPKFKEESKTLIVNAHGALIALSSKVVKGQVLLLKNPHTRTEQSCLVKFIGSQSGGKTQIGVEFTSASPLFWGIEFPPEDWSGPPSGPANPFKSK